MSGSARLMAKGSRLPLVARNGSSDHIRAMSAYHPTPDVAGVGRGSPKLVESGCGAVAVGSAYLLPPLSSGGASIAGPLLRFHTPLIEPDVRY